MCTKCKHISVWINTKGTPVCQMCTQGKHISMWIHTKGTPVCALKVNTYVCGYLLKVNIVVGIVNIFTSHISGTWVGFYTIRDKVQHGKRIDQCKMW